MNTAGRIARTAVAWRIAMNVAAWACGLGLAVAVGAHDTWLQPERFVATPGATLDVDLTSADGFVGAGNAIKPERIERASGRLAGGALTLAVPREVEKALRFSVTLTRPGVAVLAIQLKPRLLELEADKIEPYFREIHAGEGLRAAWAAVPEPRRWRETYVKNTKAFVRVGEPDAAERAWAEPAGLALEIMPERDPTLMRMGEELPVRVLRHGQPMAGFTVAFVSAGETREHVVVTDAEGRAKAVLDARGAWLVHGTDLRWVGRPDCEWESDFTTMVVEAR